MIKFDDSKKKILFYINTIILALEIIAILLIIMLYKGVYDIEYLIPICIVHLIFIVKLIRNQDYILKVSLVVIPLILFVFIAFITKVPRYTYSQGRKLIENKLSSEEAIDFISLNFSLSTIPSSKLSNRLLDNGRIYYYKINIDGKYKYFVVNQYTGRIKELSTDYWSCY